MTGQPNSALEIYLRDRRSLLALACSIVEDQAVAEELVQESWLRWHDKGYVERDARPIFRRIVSNLALDWGRRQTREAVVLGQQALFQAQSPCSEHVVIARQDLVLVISALRELPRRHVTAFRLRMFSNDTFVQIGKKLGISRSRAYELVEDTLVHLALSIEE